MVELLLDFIRANRDGLWKLHLDTFAAMLPWLTIYDHTNYARWGPVYLSEMRNLEKTAPQVYQEFMMGNFVIKRSKRRFNQVPADQATEWMNRMCKISNGIIGITRNDPARDRFCTTWAERSNISYETKSLMGIEDNDELISTRKEATSSRMKKDEEAVQKLVGEFTRFDVFRTTPQVTSNIGSTTLPDASLISLATNDIATPEITKDVLSAYSRGVNMVKSNVSQRLVERSTPFFHPMTRNNTKTFATLYKINIVTKQKETKTIKADRKLIQQLFNASSAGRKVELLTVLQHELSPVPLSLAKIDGSMNTTSKADILTLLSKETGVNIPSDLPPSSQGKTCVVIDGHALIQSMGKPRECKTFEDYGSSFSKVVLKHFKGSVTRVDVAFDRYQQGSIKCGTRIKRKKMKRPIRKIINRPDVPLPEAWDQFIAMSENKADLANYLSGYLMDQANQLKDGQELVTGGGFAELRKAQSTVRGHVQDLSANHEEADTRLVLHSKEAIIQQKYDRVEVMCRDTDVLLLLMHFCSHLHEVEVWMVSGTSKQRKCYPVHLMCTKLSPVVLNNILGFHALTGCDSTSSFTGYGKKSCWKTFIRRPELLNGVGRNGPIEPIEEYVCSLYGVPNPTRGVDVGRHDVFVRGKKDLEKLPPTKDALELHYARSNYQAKIWLQADVVEMDIDVPDNSGGWKSGIAELDIVWSRLPPVPSACIELISCGCGSKCRTTSCSCFKSNQTCTPACACYAVDCCNAFHQPGTHDEAAE